MQPQWFPTRRTKIMYIIYLLTGRTLQWAKTIWEQTITITRSLEVFTNHFKEVFGQSANEISIHDQLYKSRQGKTSVTEYSACWWLLVAGLKQHWLQPTNGLSPLLQLQLSVYDDTISLENLIQCPICISQRMATCHQELFTLQSTLAVATTSPPAPAPELMQVDTFHISTECQRSIQNHLCLYCGAEGHLLHVSFLTTPKSDECSLNAAFHYLVNTYHHINHFFHPNYYSQGSHWLQLCGELYIKEAPHASLPPENTLQRDPKHPFYHG